jgi:hypothetical protein
MIVDLVEVILIIWSLNVLLRLEKQLNEKGN